MSESAARSYSSPILLSQPQRNHLIAFLHHLEDTLVEVERGNQRTSVDDRPLTLETDHLSPTSAAAAEPLLRILRQHLKMAVQRLALEPTIISKQKLARESITQCLLDLLDSGSHALRGYGPMDPGSAAELDMLLADLREPVERLLQLLEPPED